MSTGSTTILLVDDDEVVRVSLQLLLEATGYRLFVACDGAEALRLFRNNLGAIDLVITDHAMPGMNGRELVERVWSLNPDLPVLYISGKASAPLLKQGVVHERAHFLSKPFSYKGLLCKLRDILAGPLELGVDTSLNDRLIPYANSIGVVVKLDAGPSGVRVFVPSATAPINDAVIASYIEEEMGLQLREDHAVAPTAWRSLGIIAKK